MSKTFVTLLLFLTTSIFSLNAFAHCGDSDLHADKEKKESTEKDA
jgi:hypothetical protein